MCSSLHMKLKYTTHDVYVSSSSLSRLIQCSSCKKTMEEGVTNMKMEVIVQCSGSSLKARVSVGISLMARISVGISLKARVSVGISLKARVSVGISLKARVSAIAIILMYLLETV